MGNIIGVAHRCGGVEGLSRRCTAATSGPKPCNLHQQFFAGFTPEAREVLDALVEKYRLGGITELDKPEQTCRLRKRCVTCKQSIESCFRRGMRKRA
jgi:hypothetical protein